MLGRVKRIAHFDRTELNISSTEFHFVTLPAFASSRANSISVFFGVKTEILLTPRSIFIASLTFFSMLESSTVTINVGDVIVAFVIVLINFKLCRQLSCKVLEPIAEGEEELVAVELHLCAVGNVVIFRRRVVEVLIV